MARRGCILYGLALLLTVFRVGQSSNNCIMPNTTATSYEIHKSEENTYANFSTQLAGISGNLNNPDFRLEIKVCEAGTQQTACRCWWMSEHAPKCKHQKNDSICDASSSEMRFSLLAKRTHSDIMWVLFKQNFTPAFFKHTALQIIYPSKIMGLQVNGQEVNDTCIIEENQETNVSCTFTNGNPSASISLLDATGHILSSTKHGEGPLVLSLGVFHCHNVWPTIRCEAPGSASNRSVSILVRCPIELSYTAAQVQDLREILARGLTVGMKSYTSDIRKCSMTQKRPKLVSREVKCVVSGRAPDFNLTLHFEAEIWIGEGIWMLQVMSELGLSSITFQLIESKVARSRTIT